jgi:hypothetical protein
MFEREFSLSWALRNVGWPKYLFAESTSLRRLLAGERKIQRVLIGLNIIGNRRCCCNAQPEVVLTRTQSGYWRKISPTGQDGPARAAAFLGPSWPKDLKEQIRQDMVTAGRSLPRI